MKRRYIYSILVGVPGLVISLVFSVAVFAAIAGVLWIFVFGDNPWPAYVETALPILFIAIFVLAWLSTLVIGYFIGKAREQDASLNKLHVLISAGVTILFLASILLYEWNIGNLAEH